LKTRQIREAFVGLEGGEVEAEVGARCHIDSLEESLSLHSVDDLEVGGIVESNGATQFALLHQVRTNAARNVSKVRKFVHSTVQVSPDRLDLGNAEE
jgi:hypothetical protein